MRWARWQKWEESLTKVCIMSWSFSEETCSEDAGPGMASAVDNHEDLKRSQILACAFTLLTVSCFATGLL